jgi:excisionase family DNA binding protein
MEQDKMVKFEPKYISTVELSNIVGVSRQLISKAVKSGKIKAIKVGKNYRVPIEEAKRILKEGF